MNTIDYRATTLVKPATHMSMRVNAYKRVIFVCVKCMLNSCHMHLALNL